MERSAAVICRKSDDTTVVKEMKNGARTHVGVDVRRHIVKLRVAGGYEVSEKHFETNLHRI
jgi:hypothetical protein